MRSAPLADATPELPLPKKKTQNRACRRLQLGKRLAGRPQESMRPYIVGVDGGAVRDGVLVVDLPECISERF